jgi:hypothetical protein
LTGVSLSQFLAFVDAYHNDANKQTSGPGAGASPTGEKNLEIGHDFKRDVWRAFTAHPDVLVGEEKRGNGLDLCEIETLPLPAAKSPGHPGNPLSETFGLPHSGYGGQVILERDSEDASSPSAQLWGQLQPPDAQTLFAHAESTASIHDDAEVPLSNDSQSLSRGCKPLSHTGNGAANELPSNSSSHKNDKPKMDKMVDMTKIHAEYPSEATDLIAQGSGDHERLSVTSQNLTTQPRIYVSQECIRKTTTPGNGTSHGKAPGLEPSANPPKRRGRPPKIKTNEPLQRRGWSHKAKTSTPALTASPTLPTPQQTPTNGSSGKGKSITLESTPEPKKRRGRQMQKVAIFTSHDESQRAAGIPGVYFDIAELEKTGAGRPKKRKIALFKSEKLKSLSWMKSIVQNAGTDTTVDQPLSTVENAMGDLTKNSIQEHHAITRKMSRDSELEAPNDKLELKKLLDMVRGFGSSRPAPYKSPYLSLLATSYVSPYSTDASRATTSTTQEASSQNIPTVVSKMVSTPLHSATAIASAIISEYASPYTPMQPPSFKPSDHSSTPNSSAEQSLANDASQSMKDYQLEAAIKSAGELAIPNVTVRLPSSKDGIVGNLCLSTDKKSLTFVMGDTQTETTSMVIQVSNIIESPETSKVGSETMALRITASTATGVEETHNFRFLPTENAFRAANNMRAKIVTAMMLQDIEDNTETVEPERPFKCGGCDGSWKNWEGLKYHQTKSKTLCNPNYTPRKERTTHAGQDILGLAAAALDVLNEDIVAQSQKFPIPEESCDSAVAQQPAKRLMATVASIKSKDARSDPELQRGKDIIMALLDSNEQVFPGEKSLWYAFMAALLQKYPDSGLPSYGTCNIALDLLADTGQIRKLQFSFKDKSGLMKMRSLITRQDVDPASAVVVAMKENIKAAFPEYYVPSGFAPPKVVQSMLEERQNRPEVAESGHIAPKVAIISQIHNPEMEQMPEGVHTPFNDTPSNKVTRSGRISRRPQRLQQSALESSIRDLEDAVNKDDDDSYAEDFSNHDSTSQAISFAQDGRRKRKRLKAFKTNIQGSNSTGGTNYLREANLMPPPHMIEDNSQQETDSDRPHLKRRKNEMHPAEAAPNCKAMWQPAPLTYLQGKNGAWNTPIMPRMTRKKYAPRTGLPEPITYMQTLNNSAWCFRPYGHGVRPIHARPSKRAEGQTAYLTRIQRGFRPVMMPNGEVFIPSTPSSNMIEQTSEAVVKGVPQPAGSTRRKRKYKRDSSNITESQETVKEGLLPSAGSITKKRKFTRRTLFSTKTQVETPPQTSVQQRLAAPKNDTIISTTGTLFPEDEHILRNIPVSPDSDPFLDDLEQSIPPASIEFGAEPAQFDDRFREGKAWYPNQRAPIAQYMMTARRLTALPADLEGIEESLADHPDLKVEVAVDHQHNIRRRTREEAISTDTEYRLIVAVVVIRTLTGGLDKQVDWVLVSKLFPDLPMNAVSKRWPSLYTKHKQMVERLGTDFQEFFLGAYERGEVSPIDYDHLVDYDWNSLVNLVLERIDTSPSETITQRLPASRSILHQMYKIDNAGNNKVWRDEYFGLLRPVYRRMEYAASEQHTIAVSQELLPNLEVDQFTVAKSWARANTLTPSESYDKDFAAHKLAMIGNGVVAAATSALFESKVLMQRNKGRPTPNRGVEITDTFAAALRKHLDETHLVQAVACKASLDAKFRAGATVTVEWAAKDGEILAITNLQAHGRIRLEPKGVPMNKFGLTGGGYQTKKMDKAVLHFDLQILPTSSYIYDADIPILSALTSEFLPPRGIAGAIPIWYDIAENLIPAMWKKVLCVVLATIAMRPGAVLKELVRIFTPALEEWEMQILIEWGLRVGALTVLREGYDGWNVAEWWWVIGGWA